MIASETRNSAPEAEREHRQAARRNEPRPGKPTVLIYREELLRISETFIKAQAEALTHYAPVYLGLRRAERNLPLDAPSTTLSSGPFLLGYLRAQLFFQLPVAPVFLRRLARMHPALIHAHFATDAAQTLSLQRGLDVPLLATLHGFDIFVHDEAMAQSARGRLFLRRRAQLWEQATYILCVSDAIRRQALERGVPERKLLVHYTGVDLAALRPAPPEGRDQKLIVFVGRLVEKKGCAYLIEAVARLGAGVAQLEVIGDGPERAALEAQASALSAPVRFLGAQPAHVVSERMAHARVLCGPSVQSRNGDSEGFGMVFAEAQAVGTPVVSTLHSAIPEVVLDGETGLLAPERDPDALCAHLQRILGDDALWLRFHHRGMEHVRARFGLAAQTRRLEAIYAAAVEEHAAATRQVSHSTRGERSFG